MAIRAVRTINNLNGAHVCNDHRRFMPLMTTVLKTTSHKRCVVYIVECVRVRHECVKFHSRNAERPFAEELSFADGASFSIRTENHVRIRPKELSVPLDTFARP